MAQWRRFLMPGPAPAGLLAGALGMLALGVVAAGGYGLSQTGRFLTNFGFVFGLFCTPASLLLLAAGVWLEKQPLPRAGLLALMGALLAVSGLFVAAALAVDPEAGPETGVFLYLLFCLPPVIASAALAIYFANRGLPRARAALDQSRADRALAMLEARGEATLAELAAELAAPPEACDDIVDGLLRSGRLAGVFDAPRGRVYTQAGLRARQQRLAAVVQAHGQMTFDDLARELGAPRELLRQWVYALVERGEFTGYLNWQEGRLYSADAARLRDTGRCPQCGGALALAGQGVIQCAHCGSEVFLA